MIDNKEYLSFLRNELPKLRDKKIPFWNYTLSPRNDTLRYCLRNMDKTTNGLIAEFGVWKGSTINMMSSALKDRTVYGFDSFTGFPDDGRNDWDQEFSLNGQFPKVSENVKLVKGYYCDTLPAFVENNNSNKFDFIHIDCDIYSSTKDIFDLCKNLIQPGCIIVFDELLHYQGFENNEMLAFYEFIQETNHKFEWLGTRGKVMGIDEYMDDYQSLSNRMAVWRRKGLYQEVAVKIL